MARGCSFDNDMESASAEDECIRIGFQSQQSGESDYYRAYNNTKIQDLVQAYCKKRNIEYKAASFIYNFKKLPYRGTVGQVGLKDQDQIEVMFTQTGA